MPAQRAISRRPGRCRCASRPAEGKSRCEILSSAQQSLAIPKSDLFFADAAGKGYYRSAYPANVYAKLVANVETGLTPEERIALIGDEWALVRANKVSVGDYLDLTAAIKDDPSGTVVGSAIEAIAAVKDRIATTPQEREALAAWARKTFRPSLDKLGPPSKDDTPEKASLRTTLFGFLGTVGNDPEIIAQARRSPRSIWPIRARSIRTLPRKPEDCCRKRGRSSL